MQSSFQIYTDKNYSQELIERIIQRWEGCVPESIEPEIVQLLEYLKQKYDMVILTDWFVSSQKERLRKVNILQYFKQIYGAEKTKRKPYPEAFLQAIGENKPEECVMIGDSFKRDIEGAISVGIQAIWYCQNSIKEDKKIYENKYKIISNLMELKKYL